MKTRRLSWPGWGRLAPMCLGLGLLALVCLGGFFPAASAAIGPSKAPALQVILALDTSGGPKTAGSLRLATDALAVVVHLLEKGDRLGLLAFAGSSRQMLELRPLTPKHRRRCLRELQRLTPGEGPADFAALLQAALKAFGSPEASRRVLVILTPARLEAASRPGGGAATRKRLGQKLISSYKRARVAV
ncbi:MAG: VWA domain-containing protein, partial [Deltaproteobacteria bacterium]|nr:VWA domain-containing protein [Deltaproteobacteria bacterium]